MKSLMMRLGTRYLRPLILGLGAASVLATLATSVAAAAPSTATDLFVGDAVTSAGQTSPIDINPFDMTVRPDGAIGFGYRYQATGRASGQLPGSFTYQEHGYLYFTNPGDPNTMVGSAFSSGIFSLTPTTGGPAIQIADTAPQAYTSGIQTITSKLEARVRHPLSEFIAKSGPLTYGYFTFTNPNGTFTGYATPDFAHFAIRITFRVP